MATSSSPNKEAGLKLAPFRSLNDFLLDLNRYQAPAFNDLKRINNRITSNLLYYQTNYFTISSIVFFLTAIFKFNRLVLGAFGIATTIAVILFQLNKIPQASALKAQYPISTPALAIFNLIILYLTFNNVLLFLLVLLVPVTWWMIHGALRCRGLKNKINNKMEQIGAPVYKNTPMGQVLTMLGLDPKDNEE